MKIIKVYSDGSQSTLFEVGDFVEYTGPDNWPIKQGDQGYIIIDQYESYSRVEFITIYMIAGKWGSVSVSPHYLNFIRHDNMTKEELIATHRPPPPPPPPEDPSIQQIVDALIMWCNNTQRHLTTARKIYKDRQRLPSQPMKLRKWERELHTLTIQMVKEIKKTDEDFAELVKYGIPNKCQRFINDIYLGD